MLARKSVVNVSVQEEVATRKVSVRERFFKSLWKKLDIHSWDDLVGDVKFLVKISLGMTGVLGFLYVAYCFAWLLAH